VDQAGFERLYRSAADPYGTRTRWYEARKRALVLAALPEARYGRAFEPACGIGELTRELAPRCGQLLASDFSARAVAAARERTRAIPHVRVETQRLPDDWPHPPGGFDLILLAELGYFLAGDRMEALARCCGDTLAADGTLLACHWLPPFGDRTLATEEVHGMLDALGLPCIARYRDADFEIAVWRRSPRSVAQREGIRPG